MAFLQKNKSRSTSQTVGELQRMTSIGNGRGCYFIHRHVAAKSFFYENKIRGFFVVKPLKPNCFMRFPKKNG
jgi:hypothetical protein